MLSLCLIHYPNNVTAQLLQKSIIHIDYTLVVCLGGMLTSIPVPLLGTPVDYVLVTNECYSALVGSLSK